LLAELARETLNFVFSVALPEESRIDGFSDLNRGVGPRSEDRHPNRVGAVFVGFRMAPLAPGKARIVVAGAAGVAGCPVRRGTERRAERKTVDDEVWIGRRCDNLLGGWRRNRNGSGENWLGGRWNSERGNSGRRNSGRWSGESRSGGLWNSGGWSSESAGGEKLSSPGILRPDSLVRQLLGR
jgi:hypothetical protein